MEEWTLNVAIRLKITVLSVLHVKNNLSEEVKMNHRIKE